MLRRQAITFLRCVVSSAPLIQDQKFPACTSLTTDAEVLSLPRENIDDREKVMQLITNLQLSLVNSLCAGE